MPGKLDKNLSVLPLFMKIIMLIIYCAPFKSRCFLLCIRSIISLNNKKVTLFTVKRGYLIKRGIIISSNSLIELTMYTAWPLLLSKCILSTPWKKVCILYNKFKYSSFSSMEKADIKENPV